MTRTTRMILGATLVAISIGLSACSSTVSFRPSRPDGRERIDGAVHLVATQAATPVVTDHDTMSAVARADSALGLAMLRRLGSSSSNVTVSPLSLYPVLAMLQNGARGRTATQIAAALQATGLSTADQNAGWAALSTSLSGAAKNSGITLDAADSLWMQKGVHIRRPFLTDLARYYGAGVWQSNFQTDGPAAINHWVDEHTEHKIPTLFDQLDPGTELVLADALYLHASWQYAFDSKLTAAGTFTTASGARTTARFMAGPSAQTWTTPSYSAAELPYRGGRFAALAIMPAHSTLPDFVAGLTPSRIAAMTKPADARSTGVSLPRFTTRSSLSLPDALESLGMRDAFGPAADFSAIDDDGLYVSQAVQKTYLQVAEQGTTAAAATGTAMKAVAARFEVRFDHPFLFLVQDTVTGAILFASEINNPAR